MALSKSLLESKEINILSQDSAPVVFPVGNPCLYLLLLRAFVWEVCETILAGLPSRRKLNVSIVRSAQ